MLPIVGRKGQKAMDDRAAFQKSDFGALFAADLDRSAHKRGLGAVYMMASDTMRSSVHTPLNLTLTLWRQTHSGQVYTLP